MLAGRWQDYKVSEFSAHDAQALSAELKTLSQNALQPAGYNAPELILPLLKNLGDAQLMTVKHGPDVLLAFPVSSKRLFLKTWQTPLTASGLPAASVIAMRGTSRSRGRSRHPTEIAPSRQRIPARDRARRKALAGRAAASLFSSCRRRGP